MRRAWPLLLVLLAIVAVAWCLRPADVEEGKSEAVGVAAPDAGDELPIAALPPADSEAHLEGRPDAVVPPRPASTGRPRTPLPTTRRQRFYGTVRDPRGTPLPGVAVYQLSAAGSSLRTALDQTDEKGWWWIEGAPREGTWICARRLGFRSAFVDALRATESGELHLVLEESPPLVVRLVDTAGEPVAFGAVRAVPTTGPGPRNSTPGPEATVPVQLEFTDHTGIAVFRFDRALPLMLVPEVEGMVCVPPRQYAPTAEGTFSFELQVAGGFEITAVDPQGERIDASLRVSVRDVGTGEELASYRGSEPDGALEAEPPLPPGPYHLDLSARGYEPTLLLDFELPTGPGVVRRTVVLQRLAEAARLRILLPQPTGEPKRRAVRGSGWSLLLRRTDGPWAALGWIEHGSFAREGQAAALTVRLQPGTWEAVVSGARHDVVGRIEPVALRAGAFVERSAHVVPSTSFSLYDVLPPDLEVRTVRVVAPGYGRLPPIGSWLSTAIRDAESLVQTLDVTDSEARRTKGGGALLGPFPGAHVVVEVDDWNGHTHRFTVGR